MSSRHLRTLPLLALTLLAGRSSAEEPPADWQFELKRSLSDRGSPQESTRTTLRLERLLDGPLRLLRLDIPMVDKRNAFDSDPTAAGLGDLKLRARFAPLPLAGPPLTGYLELTLPTAASSTLGGGKYVVAAGLSTTVPLPTPWGGPSPRLHLVPDLKQVVSVAGPADRKDVNYTQAELKLELDWPGAAIASLAPKPVIDWTKGAATAAVVELKGTWLISPRWRAWLTLGQRLWGERLPGTYDSQLELGVRLSI